MILNDRLREAFSILILLFISATTNLFGQVAEVHRELTELSFNGKGFALGYAHGSVLQLKIGQILEKWKANTSEVTGRDADEVIEEFLEYAQFTDAIRKWTPELYDEIRGIAQGAGQSFNDILVLNLLDEFWVYLNDPNLHHCTSVGIPASDTSPTYLSQNMDLENYTDGFQTLIHLDPGDSGPKQMILTHPGLIALNGMNEQGIGVCVNTLMQLKASSKGLPVAFIVRKILSMTNRDEILAFIQIVRHASGQNYMIGISDEVFDFEASANKVKELLPEEENGPLYHTNHPIVNDDYKPWFLKDDKPDLGAKPGKSNTEQRYAEVENRMHTSSTVTQETIESALRSKDNKRHPVCRANATDGRGFTFASTIMILTGTPHMYITAGPPDESDYRRIEFKTE